MDYAALYPEDRTFMTSEVYTSVISILNNTRKRIWACLKYADFPKFIIPLSTAVP
jgi:hypothetical protein